MKKLRSTFTTPFDQYKAHEGQPFELVGMFDVPDDNHDAEVLPMFLIRMSDGLEIEAWPEEVWE
jgi:hypothetical protein